jgi:fimbrial chaperone protein
MKIQQINCRALYLALVSIITINIDGAYQQRHRYNHLLTQRLSQYISGLILLVIGVSMASAGSFQVNPVRATLSPSKPVSAMTVRNTGTESAVIQLEVMTWSQQQGKDVYATTKEILATPPVFTVPAGGSQVIRVGLRRAPDAQREITYRLFLQEVPPPPKPGFQGLQVALRIGVPVFVTPATEQPPALAWKIYRTRDGKLEVSLTNNGGIHVQVANFKLVKVDGGELGKQHIAAYVLPGQTNSWVVKDISVPQSASTLHLFAQTDAGDIDAGVVTVESK